MKPPPFDYHVPTSVAEAIGMLSSLENARLLAGGQSLMPMLNMRYAFPDHVIDLNRIGGLDTIAVQDDVVVIGAMTRQRDLLENALVAQHLPLLTEALTHVGHRQTRNRGTIGGSLCHLDPAAELVTVAATLDAVIEATGPGGTRDIPIADFALGYMTPAIEFNEMVTAIRLPIPARSASGEHGHAFVEFSRRHGDFAIVSAAALLTLDDRGRIAAARLTLGGVGAVPLRMTDVEAALVGNVPDATVFAEVVVPCGEIAAMEDALVPGWYRSRLAEVMARRALDTAASRIRKAR